jgi:hypothetical protein
MSDDALALHTKPGAVVAPAEPRYTVMVPMRERTFLGVVGVVLLAMLVSGCGDTGRISAERARAHVLFLTATVAKDVEEVRAGLPLGADAVAASWKAQAGLETDLKAVREVLEGARRKVQDLRVAKSTFFALADLSGTVLRNDQDQDRMAGRPLLAAFPALVAAKERYTETIGSLPEASGVRAPRADGQWVAASPVRVDGATRGLYVTGWSWAAYAYRLEFALRGQIRSELMGKRGEKEPLVYVFVVVGKAAYGAPVTPEVSATTVAERGGLAKDTESEPFTEQLQLTGRTYGLSVHRAPQLGANVGIAVLRSET